MRFLCAIYSRLIPAAFPILIGLPALAVATEAQPPPSPIIANFSKVAEGVYRGARPSTGSASYVFLRSLGIKTIINLEGDAIADIFPGWRLGDSAKYIANEKQMAAIMNFKFINKPLFDLPIGSESFRLRVLEILEIMSQPANQPVFIHCLHGADRTGLLVALYKVKYLGWNAREAWHDMLRNGHNVLHYLALSGLDEFFVNQTATWAR